MITTPLSRLAGILNVDISSMNRADAQDAVCEAAIDNINRATRVIERQAKTIQEMRDFRDSRLDAERLDYLDSLNQEFNERNNSNYGWEIDWNHNRIALHDIGPMGMSVRQAIDEHRERVMNHQKAKKAAHD